MHHPHTVSGQTSQAPAILVFRSALLGDFILAVPALSMLRKLYPKHRIVLLTTQSANKKIQASAAQYSPSDRMPWVRLAMPHLVDDAVAMNVSLHPRYLWTIRRRLRVYAFTSIFMLIDPGAPWLGRIKKWVLLALLAGPAPIYGWRAKGSLNGDRARLHAQGLLPHHVHGPLHFTKELKPPRLYSDADIHFPLTPPPEARRWALGWLNEHVPAGRRLLFVAPGSIQPHKRWPLALFCELITALQQQHQELQFIVIGTGSDHSLGEQLRGLAPERCINLAGITSLAQSAALLQHDCLLVGNDGGAMHLGDAMGAKVVSIVPGIEYPNSVEPWNNRQHAVRHPVPCAPCYSFVCCPQGHNRCMTDLPMQDVLNQCNKALASVPALRYAKAQSKGAI